jgi:hypothetical protein
LKESRADDLDKELAKVQLQESSKTHVRYSEAARCKHKKQLQKEAG